MISHPTYDKDKYERYRLIKDGGTPFVEKYLTSRTNEDTTDFAARKAATPDPGVAASAVDDVKNAFAPRMDVTRTGGNPEYLQLIKGLLGGVDRNNSSMDDFVKNEILPELLYMGKVGVLVQAGAVDDPIQTPYLLPYKVEDIWNWKYTNGKLSRLVLNEVIEKVNEAGFPDGNKEIHRVFTLDNGVVNVKITDRNDKELDLITLESGSSEETIALDEIPFTTYALSQSMLHKIDAFQIAYLNLESSDLEWLRTANLTIYTEQGDSVTSNHLVTQTEGEENKHIVKIGTRQGRRYPKGVDRPGFIAPPPGPIEISMKKQDQLQARIKDTLKTTLAEVKMASAESLTLRDRGLEAGLSTIGAVLRGGDLHIAILMHKYLGSQDIPNVTYPVKYELRTEEDRLTTAKGLKDIQKILASPAAKKELEILICRTILEGRVEDKVYNDIVNEINALTLSVFDPADLIELVNAGILSKSLASTTIGAPPDDAAKAESEHVARIAAIKAAQSTSGVQDTSPDPAMAEKVKKNESIPQGQ